MAECYASMNLGLSKLDLSLVKTGLSTNLVPATYTRDEGVRHLIAFLDLSSDRLYGHIKKRKRWKELMHILKYIRSMYHESSTLYSTTSVRI